MKQEWAAYNFKYSIKRVLSDSPYQLRNNLRLYIIGSWETLRKSLNLVETEPMPSLASRNKTLVMAIKN